MQQTLLTESSQLNHVSYQPGYIHNRRYGYLRQLKPGDTVQIGLDYLEGAPECEVISNNGERIVIQMAGHEGRISFRSFWVKNGRSCGPAMTDKGWGYPWLFYYIVIPHNFGERVIKIIDLHPNDIDTLSIESILEESEIPF